MIYKILKFFGIKKEPKHKYLFYLDDEHIKSMFTMEDKPNDLTDKSGIKRTEWHEIVVGESGIKGPKGIAGKSGIKGPIDTKKPARGVMSDAGFVYFPTDEELKRFDEVVERIESGNYGKVKFPVAIKVR